MLDFLEAILEFTSEHTLFLLIIMFSWIFFLFFAVTFLIDVFRAVYNAKKGQSYKWECFSMFTIASEKHSTSEIVLFSTFLVIGFVYSLAAVADEVKYEYEQNLVICDSCYKKFDENFNFAGFNDSFYGYDYLCPNCIQQDIDSVTDDYGGCIPNDGDSMVIERAECNWCGNDAPADLYDENGERICIDCITEALQDSNVARALQNYFEYG